MWQTEGAFFCFCIPAGPAEPHLLTGATRQPVVSWNLTSPWTHRRAYSQLMCFRSLSHSLRPYTPGRAHRSGCARLSRAGQSKSNTCPVPGILLLRGSRWGGTLRLFLSLSYRDEFIRDERFHMGEELASSRSKQFSLEGEA